MISPQLRIQGFDVTSWTNLLSLFMPGVKERIARDVETSDAPELKADDAQKRHGTLLLVHDEEGAILAAQHSQDGRIPELLGVPCGGELESFCERYGAHRCIALREGVAEELAERLALRYQAEEDYLAQLLGVMHTGRELLDAGHLRLWPNPFGAIPIPSPRAVERALDLILPDGHSMVLGIFEGKRIWTAAVLRRQHGQLDLLGGPDLLQQWTGPLGGDWRRDYRVIVDAVGRAVAPVHAGLFTEPETLMALLRKPAAGAWAQQTAIRNAIVHPLPSAAGVALGADAIRGIGQSAARALRTIDGDAEFGPSALFRSFGRSLAPITDALRAHWSQASTVSEALGFDPLQLIAAIQQRADQTQDNPSSEENN